MKTCWCHVELGTEPAIVWTSVNRGHLVEICQTNKKVTELLYLFSSQLLVRTGSRRFKREKTVIDLNVTCLLWFQWRIQDFPEGVSTLRGEHRPIIWPQFCENCMQMKKIGQGTYRNCLCRSATAWWRFNLRWSSHLLVIKDVSLRQ